MIDLLFVIFDNKGYKVEYDPIGFPVFKNFIKTDVNISNDSLLLKNGGLSKTVSRLHLQAATSVLKERMEKAANNKKIDLETYINQQGFTKEQAKQIIKEKDKIEGYNWHHHQETGRMQLVIQEVHDAHRHTGGNQLWGSGK
ncbi:HNH endonuclease [Paenibacillus sambharensis]|nr:HNH endonuclease [Paenibacillus sambharensis]